MKPKDNETDGMIFCECGAEAIQVQYDDEEDDLAYLAIWEFGGKDTKTSWKTKWRFIKHILKYGVPYGDQILLDSKARTHLIKLLQAMNRKETRNEKI